MLPLASAVARHLLPLDQGVSQLVRDPQLVKRHPTVLRPHRRGVAVVGHEPQSFGHVDIMPVGATVLS